MHEPNCIEVEGVTRGFRSVRDVVQNASLVAEAGEIYVLLGAGGCGKTTLLRMIVGELVPETGRIVVVGRDLSKVRMDWFCF
jgi:ABC-type Fe3+/spermidine/putrescine transport system ATPase subunit